jgi:hypothetical protein
LPNAPREQLWKALAGIAVAITAYAFLQDYLAFAGLGRHVSNPYS